MDINELKMPIKVKPYRHQFEAYLFALERFGLLASDFRSNGVGLLMEMGTGKTLTAIGIAGTLYSSYDVRKILVVAPLSILGVWEEEFSKFAAYFYKLTVLSGTSAQKKAAIEEVATSRDRRLQIIVVNYESAWRLEKELASWKPELIIADEGHKMKSHNTAASKAMHHLAAIARFRLLLTGTPVTNKAIDIFSQYKFANPQIFGSSFYSFRSRYFDMTGYGNHTPVMKESMEPDFIRRMHSIAFRATKAECLDLPEATDVIRKVTLEPEAMDLYKQLVKESYADLGNEEVTVTNVLTRLLRLQQLTGGFLSGDDSTKVTQVSKAKLSVLEDIIDSMQEEGKKLVVIARFVPEIDAICSMLDKKGIKHSLIKGGVKDREEQVTKFQNDPEVTVFVGQVATAGMGITLTSASTMVFYSCDYSMANYEQAKARIHRSGQKHPCTYIHLVAERSIDPKVLKALQEKANLAKVLVDDYRNGLNPFE